MDPPDTFGDALALANVPVRFAVEMATLLAVGASSFRLAPGPWSGAFMAVLAPFALSLAWGRWVSPKAPGRLGGAARMAAEGIVFAAGPVGLALAGWPVPSVALGTVAALSLGITWILGDPMDRTRPESPGDA
ncbi:MAG: YrdB family protein [Longimicrobiales bacterium]